MRSRRHTQTLKKTVSWSNLQAYIEAGLRSMKAIPDDLDVVSIKLDYPGGYVSQDKPIAVEIITREEVQVIHFG